MCRLICVDGNFFGMKQNHVSILVICGPFYHSSNGQLWTAHRTKRMKLKKIDFNAHVLRAFTPKSCRLLRGTEIENWSRLPTVLEIFHFRSCWPVAFFLCVRHAISVIFEWSRWLCCHATVQVLTFFEIIYFLNRQLEASDRERQRYSDTAVGFDLQSQSNKSQFSSAKSHLPPSTTTLHDFKAPQYW